MTARGVQFQFLGMDAPEPRPEPTQPARCEVKDCGEIGSFLYRPAGFEGFREPARARCYRHSHLKYQRRD